jgi:hypothetical protein
VSDPALGSDRATGAGISAFKGAPFILGQSAPDSSVLAGLHGPFEAGRNNRAATTNGFGLFYLEQRREGVPAREKKLRVLVQAGSLVTPRHQIALLESEIRDQHHASQFSSASANVTVVVP